MTETREIGTIEELYDSSLVTYASASGGQVGIAPHIAYVLEDKFRTRVGVSQHEAEK